jgi:hypothetical protein
MTTRATAMMMWTETGSPKCRTCTRYGWPFRHRGVRRVRLVIGRHGAVDPRPLDLGMRSEATWCRKATWFRHCRMRDSYDIVCTH